MRGRGGLDQRRLHGQVLALRIDQLQIAVAPARIGVFLFLQRLGGTRPDVVAECARLVDRACELAVQLVERGFGAHLGRAPLRVHALTVGLRLGDIGFGAPAAEQRQ